VTFAFGGQTSKRLGWSARWRFAFCWSLDAVAVDDGPLAEQAFAGREILFRAVAQTVGFGLGMSKILCLSTGID
jgi:hypothetical protein